jgi:hypothetical protein
MNNYQLNIPTAPKHKFNRLAAGEPVKYALGGAGT